MADIEYHGGSVGDDPIEVVLPNVVTTEQDEKDAKELKTRTGYKQAMKRRVCGTRALQSIKSALQASAYEWLPVDAMGTSRHRSGDGQYVDRSEWIPATGHLRRWTVGHDLRFPAHDHRQRYHRVVFV